MEKADETTNVNGETSFIDPGKELSIHGGVEMNNATPLEGSSVILGEQDIVLDGDDQTSNSKEFELNKDNTEVENDSSDSSVKLTWKHMKKYQTKSSEFLMLRMMMIEVKSASQTTVIFAQTSSIEPQGQPGFLQFSQLSTLNSEECFSANAIDLAIK
jgi:hypothetical protein